MLFFWVNTSVCIFPLNHVSQSLFRSKRQKLEHVESGEEDEIEGVASFTYSEEVSGEKLSFFSALLCCLSSVLLY